MALHEYFSMIIFKVNIVFCEIYVMFIIGILMLSVGMWNLTMYNVSN